MSGDTLLRRQPAFCPVCGADFTVYASVFGHLENAHQLRGRDRLRVIGVIWREISCALLGITRPEWNGP